MERGSITSKGGVTKAHGCRTWNRGDGKEKGENLGVSQELRVGSATCYSELSLIQGGGASTIGLEGQLQRLGAIISSPEYCLS